jgi:uncharacterized protein
MDYFLIVLGIILTLLGLAGCILPAIAGPPLNYLALLALQLTTKYQFSNRFMIFWLIVTIVMAILENIIPIWGARKFGASKRGIWGSIIGLILGIFMFPPFGIIIGPFIGAFIGEITAGKETKPALKAGFGSFFGFMTGIALKLTASGIMSWYFFRELFGF